MSERFAQLQSKATKDRAAVTVCMDRALLHDLERAEDALEEAREEKMLASPRVAELQATVDSLREQLKASSLELVFESIGRGRWSDLRGEHPPTDEQKDELGTDLDHNPKTFPPAALAASCVEPGLSLDQAKWIVDELPDGPYMEIWGACLRANVTGSNTPKDLATDATPPGEKK